jgi:CheY-like chemotaxis protein
VCATIEPLAHSKQVSIGSAVDETIPDLLIGDEVRLGQVFLNLLGNAVKFNIPHGGVTLQVRNLSTSPCAPGEQVRLTCAVSDSGVGFDDRKLSDLFEPFTQADGTTTRQFGGTGLGLTISNELIALMGGRLSAASRQGTGSVFYFTLDMMVAGDRPEKAAASAPMHTSPDDEHSLDVLLVEDHPINQKLQVKMLEQRGHTVTVAGNGAEALYLIETGRQFDIVFMDCQMPIMDGYRCTSAIREREKGSSAHLFIVGLTAHALAGDREKCLSSGMDDYVSKPLKRSELARVLGLVRPSNSSAS